MSQITNAPEIAERIEVLHSMLKGIHSSKEIAKNINDVLIHGDKVPIQLLKPAWEIFAKKKGVTTL